MGEQRKFHSVLSSTAVRLSVYSSFLDFGLTASVFLLQRNMLPIAVSSFLLKLFDYAIAYLTVAIIVLFSAAIVLKFKERVVTIKAPVSQRRKEITKLKVFAQHDNLLSKNIKQGVVKVNNPSRDYTVERIVNRNNQNFIRFNGVWYEVTKDKFDKVLRPDY